MTSECEELVELSPRLETAPLAAVLRAFIVRLVGAVVGWIFFV